MTTPTQRRQNLHQQLRDNETHINALQEQLLTAQKLAAIGTMACLAAHEFNNILVPMINYAELALKHQDDVPLMRKALEKTIKHGNRAALIIQSMLGMVRDRNQSRQPAILAPIVNDCLASLARDLQKDRINVEIMIPPDLTVYTVPSQLQQVLLNLIINARQAMLDKGGNLTITAAHTDEKTVQITVGDSGCGIEPALIDKIFEPFFSTKTHADKPDQKGTGLGLSVCKSIIEAQDGKIEVRSKPSQGATFIITLPAKI